MFGKIDREKGTVTCHQCQGLLYDTGLPIWKSKCGKCGHEYTLSLEEFLKPWLKSENKEAEK